MHRQRGNAVRYSEVVRMFRRLRLWAICFVLIAGLAAVGIYGGARAVSAISDRLPVKRPHTVIIDAGHGGEDGGATSLHGAVESGYNLKCLRLEDKCCIFSAFDGDDPPNGYGPFTEVLGRPLPRKKGGRSEKPRASSMTSGGVLLLSIHQNYFSGPQYSGAAQVFYGTAEGSRGAGVRRSSPPWFPR